ncbi:RimK/LysX family protein [Shewanella sp. 3_MG-2023]|uniref:putative ATP-dependent zinc protease n=1 Tax=Shewanella sp. 3_MG-2023 TaxID=3062635 RepID=UPI0026E382EF|nr:RimK/LysX family protein [Shewanella sp. 3_MG-2023]MDO6775251.1 RimK/LysX family protein [Shewanella sp. 3_MG-2023]
MFKSLVGAMLFICMSFSSVAAEKQVLGQTEMMSVSQGGIVFEARMDTGAVNSSLHALNIKVLGGSAKKMKDNVGKTVSFTTENEKGQQQQVSAKIVGTSTVSNSQGTETRYAVKLPITFGDSTRTVKVNLRNRATMDYKLLIGRNWLKGKYVVDVSEQKLIGPTADISIVESGLIFDTRIDTGAVENSLHATNLHIIGEDKINMENNVGKDVTFTTMNEKGEKAQVTARIHSTSLIRNAQGSEIRYMVTLTLGEPGQEFKVDVNLRDRSKMTYKLLIGRNWLQGHYIVDVDM